MTSVCILGPSGKMGRALLDGAAAAGVTVASTVDLGEDFAAGLRAADAYVDFTSSAGTLGAARAAAALRKPAVIGTTGLDADAEAAIASLAEVAPVVVAANFSLGVNLVLGLVQVAARALGPAWDTEVMEIHHRQKRDAPSGTAIAIARAIAAGAGVDYDAHRRYARDGDVGPRPEGEIGVVAVRGGDVIGEHTAYFFGTHERVEISHRATSRSIFAAGALRAAAWVTTRPPGRYDMLDVLGLR